MLFFPFRVDLALARLPLLTLLVMLICVLVFVQQQRSQQAYQQALLTFCNNPQNVDRSTLTVLRQLRNFRDAHPCDVFMEIRTAPDADAAIRELAASARPLRLFREAGAEQQYVYDVLNDAYRNFADSLPRDLTAELQYDPNRVQFERMITSTFSHGSWSHLIFNLLAFYAFAASVEVIVGPLLFAPMLLLMAVSTSLAYSISVAGQDALPTVGLSGVVFGMMALLATLAPRIRIRCFFWFVIFVRVLRVPALLLALWYVGLNIYDLRHSDLNAPVNYMAHVSGAFTGVAIGLLYWWRRADYLRDLLPRH